MAMSLELPANKRGAAASSGSPSGVVDREGQGAAKRTKGGKKKVTLEEITELVEATAELSVETKIDSRAHDSLLTSTVLVDGDHPVIVAALEEGTKINKEQMEKKGGDQAPFVRICLVFIQALAKSKSVEDLDTKHPMRDDMASWWAMITGMDDIQTKKEIRIFSVTKPKIMSKNDKIPNYAKVRLTFGKKSEEFEQTLLAFFTEMGWQIKTGPAPQSTQERKVRALLKSIK